MFFVKQPRTILSKSVSSCLRICAQVPKCLSTEPVVQTEEVIDEPVPRKQRRVRQLKPSKPSFVRELFAGKLDPEWLEYPEVLENDEIDDVKDFTHHIEGYLKKAGLTKSNSKITADVLKNLQNIELMSLKIPLEYNGREMTETESFIVHETLAKNSSLSKSISEIQDIVVDALKVFGNEEQKKKYFDCMLSGSCIPCFALSEQGNISDKTVGLQTIGVLSSDGKSFVVNGKKNWVYNANIANTMLVFFATAKTEENGMRSQGLTCCIIDKETKGVTVGKPVPKLGLHGVDVCEVVFNNVTVHQESIVGVPNQGSEILQRLIGMGNSTNGARCCALMRSLINKATEHCIHKKVFNIPLVEMDYAQATIGKMACATYAVESMTYMLAGTADTFEKPDLLMESFLTKICSSETLQFVINEYIQLLGKTSFIDDGFLESIREDCNYYSIFDETNAELKVAVSLIGLQHAGLVLSQDVRKLRNPLLYPKYILKRALIYKDMAHDTCTRKLGLEGYLHPSLKDSAEELEYCVSRLYYLSESLLTRHGSEVGKKHLEMIGLCDIAICCYAMTAVLARASRSYCIGLRNSHREMDLSLACTKYFGEKVRAKSAYLAEGPHINADMKYKYIGENVFHNKKYSFDHPTARNF